MCIAFESFLDVPSVDSSERRACVSWFATERRAELGIVVGIQGAFLREAIDVLRCDDHGHTWHSISDGLPSDFGFPIVVHPYDPDTVYVVPLEPSTAHLPAGAPCGLA